MMTLKLKSRRPGWFAVLKISSPALLPITVTATMYSACRKLTWSPMTMYPTVLSAESASIISRALIRRWRRSMAGSYLCGENWPHLSMKSVVK